MSDFDERWLQPGGIVPVDIQTTGALVREIERLRGEVKSLQGFADLWYFAMDHAPGQFEKIVTTCRPESWMHEIAKVRRGEK